MATEVYNSTVSFETGKPIRAKRHKLVRRENGALVYDDQEIRRTVQLAALNVNQTGAVMLIIDADTDPACVVAPELLKRNTASHSHMHHSVVLPVSEFESWFIASAESLKNYFVDTDFIIPDRPENIGGAKGWLSRKMGSPYSPTVDQAKFAAQMDLQVARVRSSSFDKFCRDLDEIVRLQRH